MDPYKVLGIPNTATDDEVKSAYRKLAKKYHPDANPGDKAAEQKMKEINMAYDAIINHKTDQYQSASGQGGSSYGGSSYGGNTYGGGSYGYDPFDIFSTIFGRGAYSGGYQQTGSSDEPPRMQAARNYINNSRYREALNTLSSIPESERTAKWYYYSAVANSGLGNRVGAIRDAESACRMDPGNSEYQSYLQGLKSSGTQYASAGRTYRSPSITRYCISLLLINLLCNCCCLNRGCSSYFGGGTGM